MPKLTKPDPFRTALAALDALRRLRDTPLAGPALDAAISAVLPVVQAAIDLGKPHEA